MKKNKTLLLLLIASATFMSCSKSSDAASNDSSLIVGNWKATGGHLNGVDYPNPNQLCDDNFINFYSTVAFVSTDKNCNSSTITETGTYSITAVANQYQFLDPTGANPTTIVYITFSNNNTRFLLHFDSPSLPTTLDGTYFQKQ